MLWTRSARAGSAGTARAGRAHGAARTRTRDERLAGTQRPAVALRRLAGNGSARDTRRAWTRRRRHRRARCRQLDDHIGPRRHHGTRGRLTDQRPARRGAGRYYRTLRTRGRRPRQCGRRRARRFHRGTGKRSARSAQNLTGPRHLRRRWRCRRRGNRGARRRRNGPSGSDHSGRRLLATRWPCRRILWRLRPWLRRRLRMRRRVRL
jgi:hypothetical protein